MSNDENARIVWDSLISHGLSPNQAAGICGNGSQESGFRIDATAPSTGAYGIFQWLGARKDGLFNATGDGGDIHAQIAYFWHEVENDPFEKAQFEKFLNHPDQSIEGYTYAFRKYCERPDESEAMDSNRINEAYRYHGLFTGSDGGGATPQEAAPAAVADTLDWSNLTHNHVSEDSPYNLNEAGQKLTDTDNLRPEAKYGLNVLGAYMRENYGVPLEITGGAETWTHSDGTYSHHTGWKADVFSPVIKGGTQGGEDFKRFCNSQGWAANWELKDAPHWDIDFSGKDGRDTAPKGENKALSGNIFSYFVGMMGNDATNHVYEPQQDPVWEDFIHEPPKSVSFWDAMTSNFLDSATSTGFASVAQLLWGTIAHTNKAFGAMTPVSQDDIDYVKNALPNDKDAQRFVLLNGRDAEEIKWLVNQKLVEKKRREEVAQWRAANEMGLQKAMTYVAGAAGTLLDPMMLIPIGGEIKAIQMAGRIGSSIMNLNKAKQVALYAAEMGAKTAAVVTADNYLKETFNGEKQDYGMDAAVSFLGGSVFGALGGFAMTRNGSMARRIVNTADNVETKALLHAADVDASKVSKETIENALKLHDPTFRDKVKSKAYASLEANQRVVATTYENARKLIEEASGKKLPSEAKAVYVPNEDYTLLLTDKIQVDEVDRLLSHEFGVHAGLRKAIGDKAYDGLMTYVSKQAEKRGTAFFEARAKAGSYDPEEIFAQMVEDGTLPDSTWSRVKGAFHKMLNKEGYDTRYNMEQIKEIMRQQVQEKRNPEVFHVNPDGSTAFAGIKFSKGNLVNPVTMANFYHLEQQVTRETQADLGNGILTKPLRWVARHLEQGIFGEGINSVSNTFRKYTPLIWDDPQGRGLGNVQTISAETNKQRLMNLLTAPYLQYADARQRWCLGNRQVGQAGQEAFDRMVFSAYNAKYANNVANAIQNVPKEVDEAVEYLHNLRQLQIDLGKRSATDVGSASRNLIDADWYEVDEELWRMTDTERKVQFIVGNFIDTPQQKAVDQARDFFDTYYRTFVKRDIVEAKIIREKRMENEKIKAANAAMQARLPANSKWQPQSLLPEVATPQEIDAWIDEAVPKAVDFLLNGVFDPADARNLSSLGNLSFFKERVPIDTTGILKLPNGKEFSFDNNLRTYDMDGIVLKNIQRFAGEASLLNVFGSEKALQKFYTTAEEELTKAITDGYANKNALRELNDMKKAIAEFRGVRPEDETAIGKLGALARILRNFSYAKNGANMGFNQFGELGGAMAYGGVSQLFRIFSPLGKLMEDIKYGRQSAQLIRDAEDYAFGQSIESQIFSVNWGDRVVRDALTDTEDVANKALIKVADITANLGKVTSAINMLPKMTDSMVRGMRIQTIADSIRVATQGKTPWLRNPFSAKKLRAAHVSEKDWQDIQARIRQYTTMDADGNFTGFDVKSWQSDDMNSFLKWYNLIQLQAERAIVPANRQGNKNLFKNRNSLTQLLFQFKDYTLRSINAQTMRAMKARDLDDAFATMASIVTNTAVYAARAGATYAAYKAAGLDKKAEEYKEYMFSKGNLERAIAFRSTILGSPLSFANDLYEIATGAPTIRTTVERDAKTYRNSKERTMSDVGGDLISQIPALSAGVEPLLQVYHAFSHATNDKTTQKDFKNALKLLPIPNFIPLTVLQQYLVNQSGYPEKKR